MSIKKNSFNKISYLSRNWIVGVVAVIALYFASQSDFSSVTASNISTSFSSFRNFSTVARSNEHVTDKIAHGYGLIYDSYFTQITWRMPIKILEIGLGCDMGYGPGVSSKIWPELFPYGDIWFAEYDANCVKAHWKPEFPWRYVTGDQGNIEDLKSWIDTTGGGFDFIVDDGGHTVPQQWESFQQLFFKALKPGGVYFIEDLHINRNRRWFKEGLPDGSGNAMVDVITEWIDQMTTRNFMGDRPKDIVVQKEYKYTLPSEISRIDCIGDLCAFHKLKHL